MDSVDLTLDDGWLDPLQVDKSSRRQVVTGFFRKKSTSRHEGFPRHGRMMLDGE